jgi:alkylation response protein AidB-like acyl-CoA dehydrogenase
MSVTEVRREDYALSTEQIELRKAFAGLFTEHAPLSRARDTGTAGFDADLWNRVASTVLGIAVPQRLGGDGGALLDVAIVVEEQGRHLACVPLIENVVAARLFAALPHASLDQLAPMLAGTVRTGLVLEPMPTSEPPLVGGGSAATQVLMLDVDDLVLIDAPDLRVVRSLGHSGLTQLTTTTTSHRTVLASGATAISAMQIAGMEWGVLSAAALIGLAEGALNLAVSYAKVRTAFDVPIGSFQALSHPLADAAIAIVGGRRLVHKAAWHLDHTEPAAAALTLVALRHARQTADRTSALAIHVLGGVGLSLESDAHLFFTRAKAWAALAGDPERDLLRLADVMFGPGRGH